jgi:hypothetical protein
MAFQNPSGMEDSSQFFIAFDKLQKFHLMEKNPSMGWHSSEEIPSLNPKTENICRKAPWLLEHNIYR